MADPQFYRLLLLSTRKLDSPANYYNHGAVRMTVLPSDAPEEAKRVTVEFEARRTGRPEVWAYLLYRHGDGVTRSEEYHATKPEDLPPCPAPSVTAPIKS